MQQLLAVMNNLDIRRRIIVIGATIIMFAAIIVVSQIATKPSMALLYANLDSSASGDIVQALEANGEVYDIRGSSIFVAANKRDELRMTLAANGLPANSATGYELLDSLSGFGTTSQMFDAAYLRAKEGELARTIVSSPKFQTARVHIASGAAAPFRRNSNATASITVTAPNGAVPANQATALKYLVASAVTGLSPDDVSVIDGRSGLVLSDSDAEAPSTQGAGRTEELRQSVQRLLEARAGVGRAIVEVSIDTQMDKETIVEKIFDPAGRVAISSETSEKSTSSTDSRNNSVTVASNLPGGDAGASGDSSANNSETSERINYEVSETLRELHRGPGAVKRVTVAVLVDGIRTIDPDTQIETWAPRTDSELEALSELVASAVGFDESRGDQITIKTMEFQPMGIEGTSGEAGAFDFARLDIGTLIQVAILGLVSLVLGLFVVRPILTKPNYLPPVSIEDGTRSTLPSLVGQNGVSELATTAPEQLAMTGEIEEGNFSLPALSNGADMTFGPDGEAADPVKRLKQMIEDRQDETIEILRGWMEDTKETG